MSQAGNLDPVRQLLWQGCPSESVLDKSRLFGASVLETRRPKCLPPPPKKFLLLEGLPAHAELQAALSPPLDEPPQAHYQLPTNLCVCMCVWRGERRRGRGGGVEEEEG